MNLNQFPGWHNEGLSPRFKAYFALALFSFQNTTNATGQSLRKHRPSLLDLDTNRVLWAGGLPSVHRDFQESLFTHGQVWVVLHASGRLQMRTSRKHTLGSS